MSTRLAAPARVAGGLFAFILDIGAALFKRPFQLKEFLLQAWFIVQVTIVPTALVSIPFGAVIALQVGGLIKQFGAQSFKGSQLFAKPGRSPRRCSLLVLPAQPSPPTSARARFVKNSTR
jgi:phospholipid/cholesterol/gamma-HCH transport system permease protein